MNRKQIFKSEYLKDVQKHCQEVINAIEYSFPTEFIIKYSDEEIKHNVKYVSSVIEQLRTFLNENDK